MILTIRLTLEMTILSAKLITKEFEEDKAAESNKIEVKLALAEYSFGSYWEAIKIISIAIWRFIY